MNYNEFLKDIEKRKGALDNKRRMLDAAALAGNCVRATWQEVNFDSEPSLKLLGDPASAISTFAVTDPALKPLSQGDLDDITTIIESNFTIRKPAHMRGTSLKMTTTPGTDTLVIEIQS